MEKTLPRGMRLNNPLNIKANAANKWQGKISPSADPVFEQFRSMAYGVRAAAVLMINHYDRRDANTINQMIALWAPAGVDGNPGDAYAQAVADWSGIDRTEIVDFHLNSVIRPVLKAMARFEQGGDYLKDADLDAGLAMAGVPGPKGKAPVKAPATTALGVAGSGVTQVLQQAQDAISPMTAYLDIAKYIFLGLTLAGIGIMGWQIYRNYAKQPA